MTHLKLVSGYCFRSWTRTDPFLNEARQIFSWYANYYRAVTTEGMGLAVPGAAVDPDAKIDRGGRHYFTTPWRELFGVH